MISDVGILCEGWDFPACKTLITAHELVAGLKTKKATARKRVTF